MIKAYKEEVFCAVVSEMITAQVLFISECKRKCNAIITLQKINCKQYTFSRNSVLLDNEIVLYYKHAYKYA